MKVPAPHILVVDDEPLFAELVLFVLKEHGFQISYASCGLAAMHSIARRRPELIITDVMMPLMDGCQLVAEIDQRADLAGIPILLVSALPENTVMAKCRRTVPFLRKPVKNVDLIQQVKGLLSQAQPHLGEAHAVTAGSRR